MTRIMRNIDSARATALIAMASLAMLTACTGTAPDAGARAQPAPFGATPLAVENHNWQDVTVYAVYAGTRTRLGTVTSMSEAALVVPQIAAPHGEVRLLLDPIGGGPAYLTEPILVSPGQRIELRIGPRLPHSSWMVR